MLFAADEPKRFRSSLKVELALCVIASLLACEGSEPTSRYQVCDGSDEIRLAVTQSGGMVDWSYDYTSPYGHRFLFIDGQCNVLTGGVAMRTGHLSEAEATRINDALRLSRSASWSDHEDQDCPDSGAFRIRTALGVGECACGCDDDAPEGLASAIDAAFGLLDDIKANSEALDGPLNAIVVEVADVPATAEPWPFSFAAADVAISSEAIYNVTPEVIALSDADAKAGRALFSKALGEPYHDGVARFLEDQGLFYEVHLFDQAPEAFSSAIERFGPL